MYIHVWNRIIRVKSIVGGALNLCSHRNCNKTVMVVEIKMNVSERSALLVVAPATFS